MGRETNRVTRRDFVKRGAILTASVSAFNILSTEKARAAVPIRIGLLGCGGRGRGALDNVMRAAREALKLDNVNVVALADFFADKIETAQNDLSEKWDTKIEAKNCFTGVECYKQLLDTDINYVMLCTPPVFRPPTLEAAVEAGKNIFMEKPAGVDPPGIRQVVAAGEKAKEKGLSIAAGTQRRHQKPYVETIKRIHDGAIGDIVAAQAYWCGGPIGFKKREPGWTDFEDQVRSWYHYLWLSGDHVVEQHVHNLDVINWVMGDHPVHAFGLGARGWQERGNIWDHHAYHFQYENGVQLLSMCTQYPRVDSRVNEFVQGTKGVSNCSNWIKGDSEWRFKGDSVDPYIQEHADLIDSVQKGEPINEARNVAFSTMTAIMGRMAGYSARELTWDEAYNSNETVGLKEYKLGPVELPPVAVPGGEKYTGEEGWNPG